MAVVKWEARGQVVLIEPPDDEVDPSIQQTKVMVLVSFVVGSTIARAKTFLHQASRIYTGMSNGNATLSSPPDGCGVMSLLSMESSMELSMELSTGSDWFWGLLEVLLEVRCAMDV